MIAPWLVYCAGLSVLLGLAALGLEYVARANSRSTRWIWLVAIITTVTVPVIVDAMARPASPPRVRVEATGVTRVPAILSHGSAVNLDRLLLVLWLMASLTVVGRIAITVVRLRRSRARWDEVTLDGEAVLLSADLGPAVIGLTHRRTVMPRWALEFDASSRALMLRHEAEHARAGDPYLLAAATFSLVIVPWNPVLWFLVRRLRLAIEMDCDARVLTSGANPRTYASLLLAVGERMSHTPFAWVIALATPRSLLERRIVAITAPFRPRYPCLSLCATGAGVTLALAVACGTGHPDPVAIFASAGTGLSATVAADLKSGRYAEGGDTLVIQMSQRGPDGPRGFELMRGPGVAMQYVRGPHGMIGPEGSTQYLYGRAPMVLRYPDGLEVAITKGASVQAMLDDHSHDAPVARIIRPITRSPILVDKRICAYKHVLLVGAETCPQFKGEN